ncbi:MAG: HEAT repeat domain-containing protein [Candidatus Magnetoovum sp. WYHC-5]|nr:HEAT repeat domain-containing protein [Candidatus Magnetoovum sp. WYHC-5]
MNANKLQKFTKELANIDAAKRHTAAILLSEGDERAIYPLIKALFDKSPAVQDAALHSLIKIGGEVVAYMCLPLLRKGVAQRNAALLILRELGSVSVQFLYDLLTDCDNAIKLCALDLLIEIRKGVDIQRIFPLLEDRNPNIRTSAVKAMGVLHTEGSSVAGYLEKALEDNEEWVVFAALEAISRTGSEQVVPSVSKIAKGGSLVLRYQAIETLGSIHCAQSKEALISCIKDGDTFTRAVAVRGLIKLGIEPHMVFIAEDLIGMLDSVNWEEKLLAMEGIKELGLTTALTKMIDMAGSLDLTYPENEERYAAIVDAIERISDCSSLIDILKIDNIKFRGKALLVEFLGMRGCKEAVGLLIELLGTTVRDIKRGAARALGKIAHPASLTALIGALTDEDSFVRRQVVFALKALRHMESFAPLINLINTEDCQDVLDEAVKTLLELDKTLFLSDLEKYRPAVRALVAHVCDDIEIVLRLTDDLDSFVKMAAISRLGALEDKRAKERLNEVLKDPVAEIRKVAVIGLTKAGHFSDVFLTALNDKDMWVRFYAVKAIWETGGVDFIENLIGALDDPEAVVVLGAVEALAAIGGAEAYNALYQLKEHRNESIRNRVEEVIELL